MENCNAQQIVTALGPLWALLGLIVGGTIGMLSWRRPAPARFMEKGKCCKCGAKFLDMTGVRYCASCGHGVVQITPT